MVIVREWQWGHYDEWRSAPGQVLTSAGTADLFCKRTGSAWQLRTQELRTQECSQGSSAVSGLLGGVRAPRRCQGSSAVSGLLGSVRAPRRCLLARRCPTAVGPEWWGHNAVGPVFDWA